MATWPSTIPQRFSQAGFSGEVQDVTIRSSVDAGPPKSRRRFTAAVQYFSGAIDMTKAELEIFRTFFHTTTRGGSDPFTWVNPESESAATVMFSPAVYRTEALEHMVRVSFRIGVLP